MTALETLQKYGLKTDVQSLQDRRNHLAKCLHGLLTEFAQTAAIISLEHQCKAQIELIDYILKGEPK